jgi:hypothetical protein
MNHASRFPHSASVCRYLLFTAAFLALPPPAGADPIVVGITGGVIEVSRDPTEATFFANYSLSGLDLDLIGDGAAVVGAPCDPCPAGTVVSAAAGIFAHFGRFTYQGVSYEFDLLTGGGDAELILSSPDEFTLPEGATGLVTFRSPFVLEPSSFVTATDSAGLPVIRLGLTGTGEATLSLRAEPFGPDGSRTNYFFETLRYDFTTQPIPEPSTMLLVGGGAAALWLRRRPGSARHRRR